MSASREKLKRKEQVSAAAETPAAKKGMSKGLKAVLITVCVLVVIAAVVFFTFVNASYLENHMTAATVDGHKLTPAMVNYFYRNSYNTLVNQYGDYISMLFDTSTPLDEQFYDEESGTTWADALIEQGLTSAAQTYAVYDEALEQGFTLSDEQQESIDSQITMMDTYAALYGYYSADQFIAAQYGKGCNKTNFREYLEVTYIASYYAQSISDGLVYTDEELDAEYEANPNEYDSVDFRLFTFSSTAYEDVAEDEMADFLEQKASEMAEAAANDEQAFIDLALENATEEMKEYYEDDSYTLRSDYSYASCLDYYKDWVFDAARQEGDTAYFTADSAAYVVYFLSRSTNDFNLPTVRHILISVDDWDDADAVAEAEQQANDVLDEYLAGEQTAESFAALAAEYSTDSSAEDGGLYEDVTPGQTVTEFNDWCFDENRQVGDVEVIQTTYGYHVMFFDSFGSNYRHKLVETALKNAAYSAWEESVIGDAAYETNENGLARVTK